MAGNPTSVVLAGGGTGGHIEPALALASCLRRHNPDIRITCLGTPKGLEVEMIPARGWDLELIPAYPLPRKVGMDLVRTPGRVMNAVQAVRAVLTRVEADVVVGFGGYVALPAYLAAWRQKTPFVVHEVNSPAGIANKIGARLTPFVGIGGSHIRLKNGTDVGVPLRTKVANLNRDAARADARNHFGLKPDLPTLLVFGGSQGALSINRAAAGAATALGNAGVQVLHISGARNDAVSVPVDTASPYVVLPFVEDMALAYAASDMAICRGGALSCAELTAVGLPAIYVPLPWGNGEQRRNAQPVVAAGGGILVEDSQMTPQWVEQTIVPLITNKQRLESMSVAAWACGRRDGDEALRNLVLRATGGLS